MELFVNAIIRPLEHLEFLANYIIWQVESMEFFINRTIRKLDCLKILVNASVQYLDWLDILIKVTFLNVDDSYFPLSSHSQWLDDFLDQSSVCFFDFFFVAQRIEGIAHFCLVVLVRWLWLSWLSPACFLAPLR